MPYKDLKSKRARANAIKRTRSYRKRHPKQIKQSDAKQNTRRVAAGYYRKRTASMRAFIDTFKTGPCVDCNIHYPAYTMQFDHVIGTKVRDVSKMVVCSKKRILEEMAKCELVCANCHSERTHRKQAIPLAMINVE